jgi:hypothetical protein
MAASNLQGASAMPRVLAPSISSISASLRLALLA